MACIVYVTTNLVNGKKYIGKHNGKRPNYFGSGLAIKSALKKYGKASFSKEIIAEVGTDQEAFLLEEKLSREWDVVADPNWYNMKVGGKGFCSGVDHPQFGKHQSENHRRNNAEARRGNWKHTEESKAKISITSSGENNPMYGLRGSNHPAFGHGAPRGPKGPHKVKRTQEHCTKISLSRQGKGTGDRNSMALEENRKKVSQSKIGRKRFYREDGSFYMSHPMKD